MLSKKRLFSKIIIIFLFLVIGFFTLENVAAYDLNGQTVRISTYGQDHTPLGPRGKYVWGEPEGRIKSHIEAVEELFNCNVEFVDLPASTDEVLRNDVLAGDHTVDIFICETSFITPMFQMAAEGLVYPLDDVLDKSFYDNLTPEMRKAMGGHKLFGTTFGVPLHKSWTNREFGIIWNKDLFESEGLPNLYELYEKGDWTWEAFKDIALQVTKDTDGDGEIDQFGVREHVAYIDQWAVSNGMEWISEENSQRELTLNRPEYLETLDFLQELHEANAFGEGEQNFAMWPVNLTVLEASWAESILGDASYGIVPYPKGPSAEDYAGTLFGSEISAFLPINVEKDPRELIELISALHQTKDPWISKLNIFEDKEDWHEYYWEDIEKMVYDRKSLEIWKWIVNKGEKVSKDAPLAWMLVGAQGSEYVNQIEERVFENGEEPSNVIAEIEPEIKSEYEQLIGNFPGY